MIDTHDPAWNGDGTAKLMADMRQKVNQDIARACGIPKELMHAGDQVRANGERIVGDIREAAMAPRVTWLTRLRWKLFPPASRPIDWSDKRTFITTELHTRLGWADRVRALVSGRMRATVITYTDVEVKEAESRSVVWFE